MFHLRILSKDNINKDDEVLREELLQRLIDCQLAGPVSQIAFNQDPKRLALRELPHGCWSNVYLLYQAHCRAQNQPVASKTTFFNVSQQWRSCLRFHKRSQHAVCSTCSRLKMLLRNATDTLQNWVYFFWNGKVGMERNKISTVSSFNHNPHTS